MRIFKNTSMSDVSVKEVVDTYGYTSPNKGVIIRCNGVPLTTKVDGVLQAQSVVDYLNKKGQGHYTYTVYPRVSI